MDHAYFHIQLLLPHAPMEKNNSMVVVQERGSTGRGGNVNVKGCLIKLCNKFVWASLYEIQLAII